MNHRRDYVEFASELFAKVGRCTMWIFAKLNEDAIFSFVSRAACRRVHTSLAAWVGLYCIVIAAEA